MKVVSYTDDEDDFRICYLCCVLIIVFIVVIFIISRFIKDFTMLVIISLLLFLSPFWIWFLVVLILKLYNSITYRVSRVKSKIRTKLRNMQYKKSRKEIERLEDEQKIRDNEKYKKLLNLIEEIKNELENNSNAQELYPALQKYKEKITEIMKIQNNIRGDINVLLKDFNSTCMKKIILLLKYAETADSRLQQKRIINTYKGAQKISKLMTDSDEKSKMLRLIKSKSFFRDSFSKVEDLLEEIENHKKELSHDVLNLVENSQGVKKLVDDYLTIDKLIGNNKEIQNEIAYLSNREGIIKYSKLRPTVEKFRRLKGKITEEKFNNYLNIKQRMTESKIFNERIEMISETEQSLKFFTTIEQFLEKSKDKDYIEALCRMYRAGNIKKVRPLIPLIEHLVQKEFNLIKTMFSGNNKVLNAAIERYTEYLENRDMENLELNEIFRDKLNELLAVRHPGRKANIERIERYKRTNPEWIESEQEVNKVLTMCKQLSFRYSSEELKTLKEVIAHLKKEAKEFRRCGNKKAALVQYDKILILISKYSRIYNLQRTEALVRNEIEGL